MSGSMVTIVMGNGKKHNEAVLIVGHELPDDRVCRTLPRARRRSDTSSVAGIRCWGLSVVKKGVAT